MAIATGVSVIAVLILVLVLGIVIALGVYVWQDAGRRGMNQVLWTLVVLLVPYCIGVIIYLLARSNRGDYQCPQCGQTVELQFARCPNCGATLRASCPSCGRPLEPGWKLCPQCGTSLDPDSSVTPPVRRKDRLWLVLLLLLVVPVVLVVLIVVFSFTGVGLNLFDSDFDSSYSYYFSDDSFYSVFTSVTEDDLEDCDEAAQWLDSVEDELADGQVCILRFQTDTWAGGVLASVGDCNPSCYQDEDDEQVNLSIYPAEDSELTLYVFVYRPASLPWYLEAVDSDGDPTGEDVPASITVAADHQSVVDFCLDITDLDSIFNGVLDTEDTVEEVLAPEGDADDGPDMDSMFQSVFASLTEEDVEDCDEAAQWLDSVEDELADGEVCILRFQTDTWAGGVLASVGDCNPSCYQDDSDDGSVALNIQLAEGGDTEVTLYAFVYQPADLPWYLQAVDSDGVPEVRDIPSSITVAADQQALQDLCLDMTGAQDVSDISASTETED
ncbi:MAG: zinc ribbon domain-containing protein [Clostridiales bacterium]|nr:zinc ribbon domain-containing protein [Clostridiales bacterium]